MSLTCVCVCVCVCVCPFAGECSHCFVFAHVQLEELWIEGISEACESKIKEECAPGKPMSIFTDKPHKVKESSCGNFDGIPPVEEQTWLLVVFLLYK